ncbi:threonine ammonia-lyase, biosynthetic, partial [Gemmatimonadota bacterium]
AMALVDEMVLVNTDEVCSAIKAIYEDTRSIMEPAGALAVAGMIKYVREKNLSKLRLVAINSGANMNFDRLQFVAERSLIGEKHEALFAVKIHEGGGSLRKFCREVVGHRNITEFNYRLSHRKDAFIFVGIGIRSEQEEAAFRKLMLEKGYDNVDLTDNELAKTHIRHMVGGRTRLTERELLFNFRFPEYPGALDHFLAAMEADWNISLFHYRSTGGDFGRVLVGLEIPEADNSKLKRFLRELDYSYTEETDNEAYRLFLK